MDLTQLLERLRGWSMRLLSLGVLVQLVALGVVVLVGLVLHPWLTRRLAEARARLEVEQRPAWVGQAFSALSAALLPLTLWVVGQGVVVWFVRYYWDARLLVWVLPFFVLWAGYAAARAWLDARLGAEAARQWSAQIVKPVVLVLAGLQALGLLDNVASVFALGLLLGSVCVLVVSVMQARAGHQPERVLAVAALRPADAIARAPVRVEVVVPVRVDAVQVLAALQDAAAQSDLLPEPKPQALLSALAADGVHYSVQGWSVATVDVMQAESALRVCVLRALQARGIFGMEQEQRKA